MLTVDILLFTGIYSCIRLSIVQSISVIFW